MGSNPILSTTHWEPIVTRWDVHSAVLVPAFLSHIYAIFATEYHSRLAQLIEHLICNQGDTGLSPVSGS